MHSFAIPLPMAQRLNSLCTATGVTLFAVLQTALAVLIGQYAQQEDVVLGSLVANRNRSETEPLIGCFINPFALRVRLGRGLSLRSLLSNVLDNLLHGYEHQYLPFEYLVKASQPVRSLQHWPIFQVVLILENIPDESFALPGLTGRENMPLKHHVSDGTDMTIFVFEKAHGIEIGWEYNLDLFDTTTIERVAAHWLTLLESMADNLEQRVDDLLLPWADSAKPTFMATPSSPASKEVAYLAPRTATEKTLALLWCEVLGLERVGVHDDFFALGGASLPLLGLAHRIEEVFAVHPALHDLYMSSSLAGVAEQIDRLQGLAHLPPTLVILNSNEQTHDKRLSSQQQVH